MKQECLPVVKPSIEEIQEQFIVWRNNRRHRGPVPDELWEAAVSLAEDYSIGYICKVLGLNHRQLKRKIQDHGGNGYPQEGRLCHFVELAVSESESDAISEPEAVSESESDAVSEPEAVSSPEPDAVSSPESDVISEPESDTEYVMEMEDPKGGKLRVHIKGGESGFNLLEVAKAFWGRDK
jgi:hypothetical protein